MCSTLAWMPGFAWLCLALLGLDLLPCSHLICGPLYRDKDTWRCNPKPATALLSALARRGYWNIAGQVLWKMIEVPKLPYKLPYTPWQLSQSFAADDIQESLEVNVFHCSAVISACEKSGHWRLSLALLELHQVVDPAVHCSSQTHGDMVAVVEAIVNDVNDVNARCRCLT